MSHPQRVRQKMSRRTVLLGITAGMVALPVTAGAAYLTYKKLFDPPIDPHHILTYSGHEVATDAAWSPDGMRVASTEWDAAVQVWDAATREKLLACKLKDTVTGVHPLGVVWSADGKYLLAFFGEYMSLNPGSSSFEKRVVDMVQVWDAATGQRVRNIPVMQPVTITGSIIESGSLGDQSRVIAWALNEQYLAAAKSRQDAANGKDYEVIEIWDIATGSKVSTLDPALSPTATLGSSISTPPNTPTPTPPNTPTPMATPQNGASTPTPPNTPTPTNTPTTSYVEVQKMVWAPDSGKLAVFTTVIAPDVAVTNICQMWDAPAGKKMHAFTVMDQADEIIAWSLDGRSIALGTAVYDVETGRRRAAYTVEGRLTSQAWSPDGKRLAVSSFTYRRPYVPVGTIYIVDASSGRQIAMYDEGQIDPIDNMSSSPRKMVWSPNGKDFLVVRKGIEIWRVE